MSVETKADICTEMNIMFEALSDKYLGLPVMVRVDRSDSLIELLERIIVRLKSWKETKIIYGRKGNFTEGGYTIHSSFCYVSSVTEYLVQIGRQTSSSTMRCIVIG